jgi:hypothetical protein
MMQALVGSTFSSSEQSSLVLNTQILYNLTYFSTNFKGNPLSSIQVNMVYFGANGTSFSDIADQENHCISYGIM